MAANLRFEQICPCRRWSAPARPSLVAGARGWPCNRTGGAPTMTPRDACKMRSRWSSHRTLVACSGSMGWPPVNPAKLGDAI